MVREMGKNEEGPHIPVYLVPVFPVNCLTLHIKKLGVGSKEMS